MRGALLSPVLEFYCGKVLFNQAPTGRRIVLSLFHIKRASSDGDELRKKCRGVLARWLSPSVMGAPSN